MDGQEADASPMTEEDRQKILGRLHSLLYWLGKFIPEEELLQGESIPLREVVFRFIMKENPSPEEVQGAMDLANVLEAKARELEKQLEVGQLTKGEALEILDEASGLLRAVDELRRARGTSAPLLAKTIMNRVQDERRWLSFVKQIT